MTSEPNQPYLFRQKGELKGESATYLVILEKSYNCSTSLMCLKGKHSQQYISKEKKGWRRAMQNPSSLWPAGWGLTCWPNRLPEKHSAAQTATLLDWILILPREDLMVGKTQTDIMGIAYSINTSLAHWCCELVIPIGWKGWRCSRLILILKSTVYAAFNTLWTERFGKDSHFFKATD